MTGIFGCGVVAQDNTNREMSFSHEPWSGSVNLSVDIAAIKMSVTPGRQTAGPAQREGRTGGS